jgi:hypothetical protein
MGLIEPKEALQVVRIDLSEARPSDYLQARRLGMPEDESPLGWLYSSLVAGGKSNYWRKHALEHGSGKSSLTMPTTVALALCTVVPTSSSTGATITEASYTGYARKKVEAAALNAAVEAEGKMTSAAVLEFAACTAGSSTTVGWALLDSSTTGAGNAFYWGSCTSTVISTTATPPTVNAGQLTLEETS